MTAKSSTRPGSTVARGQGFEVQAREYLEAQGLEWVASNHRCRFGEIDLIMRDQQVLAFIEVRFRRSQQFGGASASVDVRKQRRLITAARHYLSRHPTEQPCRFDVVAMNGQEPIRWIKGAFDASGY
ncbi:YraN family protein [Rhabdochromatium marinum]|uniref:YraN family protein n=1 Tax=Rhabdochromatium marinum TaxID=48729 RepID=UPI00190422F0|nr:YraN family protein [Rhabdochromatium marinum]MBK1647409.1 YraN family protein [Rhabdochromatium marinum]